MMIPSILITFDTKIIIIWFKVTVISQTIESDPKKSSHRFSLTPVREIIL